MGWISPTSFLDPDNQWTDETLCYDGITSTGGYDTVFPATFSYWLELDLSEAIYCDKIRFNVTKRPEGVGGICAVQLFYDDNWNEIYRDKLHEDNAWYEVSIGSTKYVSGAKIQIQNSAGVQTHDLYCYEFQFNQTSFQIINSIFVGGSVFNGHHLWKVVENDDEMTVINSYTMDGGNVVASAYSPTTQRLYVACVDNNIYCYNASTMSLDTSWGTNGIVSIGATIKQIVIDSSDFLVVGHSTVSDGGVSLYNASGVKQWTSTVVAIGSDCDFGIDGNIGCSYDIASNVITQARISRTDGSLLTQYYKGVNYYGKRIVMSLLDADTAFMCNGYTNFAVWAEDGTTQIWTSDLSLGGVVPGDLLHLPISRLVIVPKLNVLNTLLDTTGALQQSSTAVNGTFSILTFDTKTENIYSGTLMGYVYVHNTSMNQLRSLQIGTGSTALKGLSLIKAPPLIIDQSKNTTKNVGDEIEFYVIAEGTEPLSYQWYKDGDLLTGEVSDTITFTVDENSGGIYTCTVTNDIGSDTSDPIVLSIYPKIIDQSEDISVFAGQSVNLFVDAVGYPEIFYQWYKDDSLMSGEISSTLSFTADANSGGTYTCEVSNGVGAVESDPIVLSIYPEIIDQSSSQITLGGQRIDLFVTAIGFPVVSYQWYINDIVIPGETFSTITIYPTATTTYKCKVYNIVGEAWSNPIVITVVVDLFETVEVLMEMEIEADVKRSVALDLLRLIPEKYHPSQILLDYVDEVELEVGSWLTKVRDVVKLTNPNLVTSRIYLKQIAALIGLDLPPEDEATIADIRRDIAQAIPWYKVKGTYQSIQVIALVQKFTVNLYDMYTKNYTTFYMVDWFVGDENENPPGFDSSYYKSPHFGVEILLDKVYTGTRSGESGGGGIGDYLWQSSYLDNLYDRVENTRPVHTVPHYILLLNPKTDEFGHIIEVDGEIFTKVLADWEVSTKYFDQEGSGEAWNFDDEVYFDQSPEAFAKSVTKWILGTASGTDFSVDNPVLTGEIDVDNINITSEKIIYEFVVPKATVQNGICELGLFIPGTPDVQVAGSYFPKIDLDGRVELRVLVEIFREDLS